jgi:hypothetical protein
LFEQENSMSKIIFTLCVFAMLAITPSVRADTVVITSGSAILPGAFGGISYSFAGPNISITGGAQFARNSARNCIPCLGGTFLGGSSTITGNSLGSGFVTINGQTFVNVLFTGTLQLNAGFDIPVAFTDVTLTSGASLFANITGCQGPFLPCGNTIFTTTLLGSGTATLRLSFSGVNQDGVPLFFFSSLIFNFGSSVPTPEPMTITLLGAGVAGLAAKLRLGRRKRQR